ncbi:MAG: M1 family aminopeptidase, partial [Brevefilum sp.]
LEFCLAPGQNDLVVAASAPVTSTQESCYQYSSRGVRNFSLAISPHYQVTSTESELVTVWAYTFHEHAPLGQRAADLAVEAWATFTDLYGHNGRAFLSIVEADMFDGLETDGLIYLSEWYYQTADPSPQNYFELLIVHETAHQWFYAYVHNDPAQEPWLDEALATYSELLFYEAHHPQLADWWWNFRVHTYEPQGAVNASIYEFNQYRPYINAVYLRGAAFLHALRREVGDPAFFAGLLNYLHAIEGVDNIRGSADLLRAFEGISGADLTDICADYFQ